MQNTIRVLIGISAVAFVLAVIATLLGGLLFNFAAESYSRACSNLALISIALTLSFRGQNK